MGILLAESGRNGPDDTSIIDKYVRGRPKGDPVFDGWLNHHLSQLYGPIVDEPIPDKLLRLLEERLR
jgi:hypothetical protein